MRYVPHFHIFQLRTEATIVTLAWPSSDNDVDDTRRSGPWRRPAPAFGSASYLPSSSQRRVSSGVLELSFLFLHCQFLSLYFPIPTGTPTCPRISHLPEKKRKPWLSHPSKISLIRFLLFKGWCLERVMFNRHLYFFTSQFTFFLQTLIQFLDGPTPYQRWPSHWQILRWLLWAFVSSFSNISHR